MTAGYSLYVNGVTLPMGDMVTGWRKKRMMTGRGISPLFFYEDMGKVE